MIYSDQNNNETGTTDTNYHEQDTSQVPQSDRPLSALEKYALFINKQNKQRLNNQPPQQKQNQKYYSTSTNTYASFSESGRNSNYTPVFHKPGLTEQVETPLVNNSTVTNHVSEQTSTVTPKSYLAIPGEEIKFLSKDTIKLQKNNALSDLDNNLNLVKTMENAYILFLGIKRATQGILRYRREYFKSGCYGDTVSYKAAIRKIFEKTKALILTTVADYAYFIEIRNELKIIGALTYKDAEFNIDYFMKQASFVYSQQIKNHTTLAAILKEVEQLINPNNIFRKEGSMAKYKMLLLMSAKRICEFKEFNLFDQPILNALHAELISNKSYIDKDWDDALNKYNDFLGTANLTTTNNKLQTGLTRF